MKDTLLTIRIFILSLVLGPIPAALIVLAITSAPVPSLASLIVGAMISIYMGMSSTLLIGRALGARSAGMEGAVTPLLHAFDRAWDALRQSRRQKGLPPEFATSPASIRLMIFTSARALVFPVRSLLLGRRVIFVSTGAISAFSEAALTDSLSRALIGMNSATLPARCWASALVDVLMKLVPLDAGEVLLAFESSPASRPITRPQRPKLPGGMKVLWVLFFWILSPWLSQLIKATQSNQPVAPGESGLREAFTQNLARSGAAVESEKLAGLDSGLTRHVPVALDGLVRGV